MAILNLTDISVDSGRPTYEKFDIEKNDKVRILIPKLNVAQEYVHVFHNDTSSLQENDRGKQVARWSRESFAGMYVCTGDPEVVARNPRYGDPAGCPACRRMHDASAHLIETPRKTFAMNVIQYNTKAGDNLALRNNNVEVKLWRHADTKKIETLIDIARQVKNKIHTVDILITADNTEWKKLTITPSVDGAMYTSDPELKEAVASAIKNDLYDNDTLRAACGNVVTAEEMEAEIKMLFNTFNGSHTTSNTSSVTKSSDETTAEQEVPVMVSASAEDAAELDGLEMDDLSSLID